MALIPIGGKLHKECEQMRALIEGGIIYIYIYISALQLFKKNIKYIIYFKYILNMGGSGWVGFGGFVIL